MDGEGSIGLLRNVGLTVSTHVIPKTAMKIGVIPSWLLSQDSVSELQSKTVPFSQLC
jgi:hypothetical protein